MSTFHLCIQTPKAIFFEGEVSSLKVPLADGKWEILAHHEDALGAVIEGRCEYDDHEIITSGGMVFASKNRCDLLVEIAAEMADWDKLMQERAQFAAQEMDRRKQSVREHRESTVALSQAMRKMQKEKEEPLG